MLSAVRRAVVVSSPLHSVARFLSSTTQEAHTAVVQSPTSTQQEPVLLYASEPPRLVLMGARLFALQGVAASAFSLFAAWREYERLGSVAAVSEALLVASSTQHPQLWLALCFAAVGGAAHVASSAIMRRIVIGLHVYKAQPAATVSNTNSANDSSNSGAAAAKELKRLPVPGQSEDDVILVTRPALFGRGMSRTRHARADCRGAPPKAAMTAFQLRWGKREINQYLFPVEPTWRSDDLPYLKRLLYSEYFKAEETPAPPAADTRHIAIAGFGPYRPAQFADPHHPSYVLESSSSSGGSGQVVAVPGTPFFKQHGTVWAEFAQPAPLSLEGKRALEKQRALAGAAFVPPAHRLPRIAAPAVMTLDGGRVVAEGRRVLPAPAPAPAPDAHATATAAATATGGRTSSAAPESERSSNNSS